MRIFLLLATAAGIAAIATAAPARPGGKPGGHGAGNPGAWGPGGGHGARSGWQGRSRPATGRGRDRRHGGRHGPYFPDGFAIAWPGAPISPYGNGFFADGGGEVRVRGGRAHYDYDRSYPYEWGSPAAVGRLERDEEERAVLAPPRCTFENSVRVCRGP